MADSAGLLRYMAEDGVDRCVACSFPFTDPGLILLCNDYILDASRENSRILAMTGVSLKNEDEAVAEAQRCFDRGSRGVGEIALYGEGLDRRTLRSLDAVSKVIEKEHRILMLHLNEQVGHAYKGKAVVDFQAVVDFVEDHGNLTLILAHLGGGLCFYEFMPEIRRLFSRVLYDTAASPFLYSEQVFAFAAQFLPDKVLFGSDYPLLSLGRYADGMKGLEESARQRILSGNATEVFGAA